MERFIDKAKSIIKGLWPTSAPETKENDYVNEFKNLSLKQIKDVQTIVGGEVEVSKGFGLEIDESLLKKEERFILKTIDEFGGVDQILKNRSYGEAIKIFGDKMSEHFETESRQFFEKFKNCKTGASNRYACHLDSLRANIMWWVSNGDSYPINEYKK